MFVRDELVNALARRLSSVPHRTLSQWKTVYEALLLISRSGGYFVRGENLRLAAVRFHEYHTLEHRDAKSKLVKGLDRESMHEVDAILGKWDTLYKNSILPYAGIYVNKDRKSEAASAYRNVEGIPFSPETAVYHSGLAFLPKTAVGKLKGRDVLDCGAYVGDSAYVFSRNYPFRTIYAFEPIGSICKLLEENIRNHALGNVVPVRMGVGSREGVLAEDADGSGSRLVSGKTGNAVRVTTIDAFVRKNNVNPGLVKMDIEGAEYDAVKGALSTIRTYRPVLCISIYHTSRDFFEIKPMIERLKAGYAFRVRRLNPLKDLYEHMLIGFPVTR